MSRIAIKFVHVVSISPQANITSYTIPIESNLNSKKEVILRAASLAFTDFFSI